MTKIQIILGSTRPGRNSDKVAKWLLTRTTGIKDVQFEVVDLRDYPLPFFDESTSPNMSGGKYENKAAETWANKVGEADGYVIVTPEYNHSFPAVLKNALDYVYKQWNNKPVAFVSYGGSAGAARAVEQLRLIAIELQMVAIRNAVVIPMYWNYINKSGELELDLFNQSADEMIKQLLWWSDGLKMTREK